MKFLKIIGVCALLAMSGQSFAQTVPIKFAKGSYCGGFNGNFKGKTFTIQLGKNQTLTINGLYLINPTVKDPRGKTLRMSDWVGEDEVTFKTTVAGKYTIKLRPDEGEEYYHADLKFCAY